MNKRVISQPVLMNSVLALSRFHDCKISLSALKDQIEQMCWSVSNSDDIFLTIYKGSDEYGDSSSFSWTYEREETDEEYNTRLASEAIEREREKRYKEDRIKQLEQELTELKGETS